MEVDERHRDSAYRREDCDGSLDMENGWLPVLKLVPISREDPSFIARWDQQKEELDIDILGVSESERNDFKNNRSGYSGHHTNRGANTNKHVFDINIDIPGCKIFEGSVSFSKTNDIRPKDTVRFGDSLAAQIIKSYL
jgi:hypothetical protein